jgi:hypothetical protein
MGIVDGLWMVAIVGGAGALLYRSIWKSKGRCSGCDNAGCSRRSSERGADIDLESRSGAAESQHRN